MKSNMCKILESLNSAKDLYLKTEKISEDVFNILAERDPSPTKKYLEWMCKQYLLIQERPEHIGDVIKVYDNLINRSMVSDKDINNFKTLEDLEKVVSEASKKRSKTEISKKVKKNAEVILNDKDLFIVVPKSHAASCLYGKNTKWCTTGKTPTYWDAYTKKGVKFYYIINKKDDRKYAVAVYLDGKKEIFDEKDKSISFEELKNRLGN